MKIKKAASFATEIKSKLKRLFLSVKINLLVIFKLTFKIASVLFGLYGILFLFFSWEEIGDFSICFRIIFMCLNIVFSFVISVLCVWARKQKLIWENGTGKIVAAYGDILKKGFPKKDGKKKIVVIPVNTHFDTIVDDEISGDNNPLVSPNTIHGQWIKKMLEIYSLEQINDNIEQSLSKIQKSGINDSERERGNKISYPTGTIATVKGKNGVTFFLLALSKFDDKNNAHCSDSEYIEAIMKLVEFYNSKGQGYPIYIPLMGTNLSRAGLSHELAYKKMISILELESNNIHGSVNVVVYNKEKHKVSIWK